MTANIRTPQRTVSAMQRFAVSQKNRTEAITISPFSLALPYRRENRRFSTLSCTKTGSTQPKLSAACFVVQSCLADADFAVFSDYCLIGTRHMRSSFFVVSFQIQLEQIAVGGEVGDLVQHQHIVGLIGQRLYLLAAVPQVHHGDGLVVAAQERHKAVGK